CPLCREAFPVGSGSCLGSGLFWGRSLATRGLAARADDNLILRFDGLYVFVRTFSYGSTARREVRFGERPGERPGLLVTTGQNQVKPAAWGIGPTYPINAVARFQSAGGEPPNTFLQTEFPCKPVNRQRHGRARNFNMRQTPVPHYELQFAGLRP